MTVSPQSAPPPQPAPSPEPVRQPWFNRLTVAVLSSRGHRIAGPGLCALRYVTRDGRTITFPVSATRHGTELLVVVGGSEHKTWWRRFSEERPVEVLRDGAWRPASGRLIEGAERARAVQAIRAERARLAVGDADPVVRLAEAAGGAITRPAQQPGLWRRWFWWVTVAESAGFAVPAAVGALSTEWPTAVMVLALLAAGAVEGSALGWAQAHVLGDVVTGLRRGSFVVATAVGAVAAYAVGLVPAVSGASLSTWPPALMIAVLAAGGAALLATIGTAQWLVLRRAVPGSAWWIVTTAGAWAAGLLAFALVAPPLWQAGQPIALTIAVGIAGGLAMAATVAALTGLAVMRLARRAA